VSLVKIGTGPNFGYGQNSVTFTRASSQLEGQEHAGKSYDLHRGMQHWLCWFGAGSLTSTTLAVKRLSKLARRGDFARQVGSA